MQIHNNANLFGSGGDYMYSKTHDLNNDNKSVVDML